MVNRRIAQTQLTRPDLIVWGPMQHAVKMTPEPDWPVSLQASLKRAAREQRSVLPELDSRTDAQARRAREMLHDRARRRQYFNSRLFSDPAWDILLELYLAGVAQCRVPVSSIGVRAGIPLTTVLRWLDILQKEGLVQRTRDPLDGRRIFISLTSNGGEAMGAYFESLPRLGST